VDSIGVFGIGKSLSYSEEDHSWSRIKFIEEFEELNSDYINEHYGSLQDEAYQAGLNDAWEAAKKIFGYEIDGAIPIADIGNVFGYEPCKAFCTADILRDFTVQEAIAKLKAYEDKHSDRIEVGDEVKHHFQGYGVVTRIKEVNGKTHYNAVWSNGNTGYYESDDLTKTGKHYDIQSILEAMKS
jgi:hypothetical protein